MNKIFVKKVSIENNKIEGVFEVRGSKKWINLFKKPYRFNIEYSQDISNTPISIAVIPFICNVLPIIWLFDAELIVNELDMVFYNSINDFKKGYIKMYPRFNFKGKISVSNLVLNENSCQNSAVLFSGGVDAFQTLLSHLKEKTSLVTLWGADIPRDNIDGWEPVKKHVETTAKLYGLNHYFVKTNFREYINENILESYVCSKQPQLGWWHDFQHGIAIISHTAPLAYCLGFGVVYIASSFTEKDIGKYTCASDPTIDNFVRFSNTVIKHDGYEFNRQMKIHNICSYSNKFKINIPLRVCWESRGGVNCCQCEKCYRTILAILSEKGNPKKYGFDLYNEDIRNKMLFELKEKYKIQYNFRYSFIQDALRKNYTSENCPDDLKWFYNLTIEDKQPINLNTSKQIKSILKIFLYKLGVFGR